MQKRTRPANIDIPVRNAGGGILKNEARNRADHVVFAQSVRLRYD